MKIIVKALILLVLLCPDLALSQGQIEKTFSSMNQELQEKLYLHLDRTFYVAGETVWFKAYCLDGYNHRLLNVSKVAYIEIIDNTNKPLVQAMISLKDGVGEGYLKLPFSLNTGNYIARAYTSWMKNFDPDYYFHQAISIVNTTKKTHVDSSKFKIEDYDIQFFPEGGHLVEGLRSRIGVRAVDRKGIGLSYSGELITNSGKIICQFSSTKFGLANFKFIPKIQDDCLIRINISDGVQRVYKLPEIHHSGYSLTIDSLNVSDQKFTIQASKDEDSHVIIAVHTRRLLKLWQPVKLVNGHHTFELDTSMLDEGISNIIIFNSENEPICERLYFKKPRRNTNLKIQPLRNSIKLREKVVAFADLNSNYKNASFSLSISKTDSLESIQQLTIEEYSLLTSELKGKIEAPEFYFSDNPIVLIVADNLMLTQGWSRYSWKNLKPERDSREINMPELNSHIIEATLFSKETAKPLPGVSIKFSTPSKKITLYSAVTNSRGSALFETIDLMGACQLYFSILNGNDSSLSVVLKNPFSTKFSTYRIPALVLTPIQKLKLIERSISMQTDLVYRPAEKVSEAILSESAFYGTAEESYRLDDYTRFPVMEEVMREYVKGVFVRKREETFVFRIPDMINGGILRKEPLILLDGVSLADANSIMSFDPTKVKQLDVVPRKYIIGATSYDGIISYRTYDGNGAGYNFQNSSIKVDYEGLQQKKEFFTPIYETELQKKSRLADMRQLLLWSPNLTSSDLKKGISFYTGDLAGSYKLVIQGVADSISLNDSLTFMVEH
jgi:hypothetical protein